MALVFSCEFNEISKNTFFTEHLRTTASVTFPAFQIAMIELSQILDSALNTEAATQRCSVKKGVLIEISQNSLENTCARVSILVKLHASGLQLY